MNRLTEAELRELAADDVLDDVNGLRCDKERLVAEVRRLRRLIIAAVESGGYDRSLSDWTDEWFALEHEADAIRAEQGQ